VLDQKKRMAIIATTCLVTIGLDRLTKLIAQNTLKYVNHSYLGGSVRLEYMENPGAFLSLGARLPDEARLWLLTIGVGVVLAILAYFLFRRKYGTSMTVALSLLLGGGASNLFDRAFRPQGTVIDFMNIGIGSLRTGVFNVADVAITTGVCIMVLDSFLDSRAPR
jgi:signal peptidase II